MHFADAALVTLAGALDISDALTIDRRGFRAYRLASGKAFRLHPRAV